MAKKLAMVFGPFFVPNGLNGTPSEFEKFRKDALKRPSRRVRCEWGLTMPAKMGSGNVCLEAGNTDLQLLRFLIFNRRDGVGGFHIECKNSGMPGL